MLRGVRGAITVEQNDREQILSRTAELLTELVNSNNIKTEDIGAVIFASTPDLPAAFPAAAARRIGWDSVPLFGTQEIDNPDGVPLCIRVLILLNTDAPQAAIQHAYLYGAARLRPDLATQE
ncbi:chorismate mutase [Anaerosporomusa subterranea]|uniref:chorismate mutase n=1 Tax=Anaerosporomusa subterranea TaxID=1794912 RepID=A0A154BPR7_ANASB|nr:chorismate mutase [Anaerosporomusa subterranea]KYZ75932.1 chorismate mutase [Anaerosporomusa subterranea]